MRPLTPLHLPGNLSSFSNDLSPILQVAMEGLKEKMEEKEENEMEREGERLIVSELAPAALKVLLTHITILCYCSHFQLALPVHCTEKC